MYRKVLITGATGFLGRAVVDLLVRRGALVSALVLPGDPGAEALARAVTIVRGDVCDERALEAFFEGADEGTCVIHIAGIVSVASVPDIQLFRVNVAGTGNVLRCCQNHHVGRLVYVSSVHAIPERPGRSVTSAHGPFSPSLVQGDYAKSKALATALVMDAAEGGLNASVVFPSGLIGPGDSGQGSITHMLGRFLAGRLPVGVKGGYDFVDVRDVASGIVACAEKGLPGEGYILSGHHARIRDILTAAGEASGVRRRVVCLPFWLARAVAPLYERWSLRNGRPLFFTPYAVSVLESGARFSCSLAASTLGYAPRPLNDSVRDMVRWIEREQA